MRTALAMAEPNRGFRSMPIWAILAVREKSPTLPLNDETEWEIIDEHAFVFGRRDGWLIRSTVVWQESAGD